MSSLVQLAVHASQFPENVRRDLLESLRRRQINHKFHYDSVKQAQRWLALHQAYSPFNTDPDCATIYDYISKATVSRLKTDSVHLIGLGCGGGEKDTRLLRLLADSGKKAFYTPSDVSAAMVLIARQTALETIGDGNCFPLVCDLATAHDLQSVLETISVPNAGRIISFFGMLPNFEPQSILPRLAALIRPEDYLLVSANLAPGLDYAAGVDRVLPLYDNALTREWLITFLLDLGIEKNDGRIRFVIENDSQNSGVKRITAYFEFARKRDIKIETEHFEFDEGDSIRLFFSCRHTTALIHSLFATHGLKISEEWITRSGEEGVFLVTPQ